jgi:predicted nucleic acid-binding protein
MFLLDTNVLFAAVFQAHIHHQPVSRWLAATERYATCGLTQISAFRLLLTPAAMHLCPLVPAEAHAVLADFARSERHTFVPSCPAISPEFAGQTVGPKAAFDDYLVQLAHSANCRLATMDQALTKRWQVHTLLVPRDL